MATGLPELLDVFTAREIARAAGMPRADAEALLASGAVITRDGAFADTDEAVRAVLLLKGFRAGPRPAAQLFQPVTGSRKRRGVPLTASGILHATAVGIVLLSTLGVASRAEDSTPPTPTRLVFLVKPGPGGGGGGGGLKQPAPPRPARLEGKSAKLKSPVPVERAIRREIPDPPRPKPVPPPELRPVERPIEPPPPVAKPDPVPPVVAPVASAPADQRDQAGVLAQAPPSNSQGSGTGGGSGTGHGDGIGRGSGPGIGDGSGGGTGGGPYRAGSGITAPELLREVKPDYTEEARRRALSGEVVLEIVVQSDGRVGAVKVLRGLGGGLDQRAVEAVRQWRFSPARRLGTPVDVLVEVAVEFRLR
ncbi:MAG TPA: energy transducer TonB [Vicinamibacterales bacterium]